MGEKSRSGKNGAAFLVGLAQLVHLINFAGMAGRRLIVGGEHVDFPFPVLPKAKNIMVAYGNVEIAILRAKSQGIGWYQPQIGKTGG